MNRLSNSEQGPLFAKVVGPFNVVRVCNFCKHVELVPVGRGGGRGYGMRAGNQARGRMIQHVKAMHPVEYAKATA